MTYHKDIAYNSVARGQFLGCRLAKEGEIGTGANDEILRLTNVHPEAWQDGYRYTYLFHVAIETKTTQPNNSASTDQPMT